MTLSNTPFFSPKISVITVSYNCGNTIAKTMESVLSQDYPNIEYLIIDSCSNDGTHEVIEARMNDRIRLVIEKDQGIYDAMNKGFSQATGDIIYFLNCGDYLASNSIFHEIVAEFQSNPELDVVYGDVIRYKNGNEMENMKKNSLRWNENTSSFINSLHLSSGYFCKKSSYDSLTPFNLKYQVYADLEWIVREVSLNKFTMRYINKIIAYYQEGGVSEQDISKNFPERLELTNKYFSAIFRWSYILRYPYECSLLAAKYVTMHLLYLVRRLSSKLYKG
jgi:Glycosyltransferases involved in cell wall biogenesis